MRTLLLTIDGKGTVELKPDGMAAESIFIELITQLVSDSLKSINSNEGPGFLSVEDENGFVQVAGNGEEFVVEWSEFDENQTNLFAAGRHNERNSDSVFQALHGTIHVKQNERLSFADAEFICAQFVAQRERPSNYHWRTLTVE